MRAGRGVRGGHMHRRVRSDVLVDDRRMISDVRVHDRRVIRHMRARRGRVISDVRVRDRRVIGIMLARRGRVVGVVPGRGRSMLGDLRARGLGRSRHLRSLDRVLGRGWRMLCGSIGRRRCAVELVGALHRRDRRGAMIGVEAECGVFARRLLVLRLLGGRRLLALAAI